MEYFYDHETDTMSITLGDLAHYDGSEEVAPGVVVHSDVRRRALAVEIRAAKTIVGVKGLSTFEARAITSAELSERMQGSANGRAILRALET